MQPNQTLPIRAVAVGRARRGRQHGLDDARRHQGGLRSQRPGRLHRAALQACIKLAYFNCFRVFQYKIRIFFVL